MPTTKPYEDVCVSNVIELKLHSNPITNPPPLPKAYPILTPGLMKVLFVWEQRLFGLTRKSKIGSIIYFNLQFTKNKLSVSLFTIYFLLTILAIELSGRDFWKVLIPSLQNNKCSCPPPQRSQNFSTQVASSLLCFPDRASTICCHHSAKVHTNVDRVKRQKSHLQ